MPLSGTEAPPQRRKNSALWRQGLAFAVAAAIVLLSPGLPAYHAFAADFGSRGPAGPKGIPSVSLPQTPLVPGASLPNALPAALPIPGLPVSAIANPGVVAVPQASLSKPALPGAPAAAQQGAQGAKATTTEGALRAGAEQISAAQNAGSEAGVAGALNSLFTGSKQAGSVGDGVAGSASQGSAPLAPLPLEALKAIARDGKGKEEDRRAAVKAIADRSGDPSKLLLEELGTERGGSAQDYEIKRLALRSLAQQGKVVSLPPVSAEHAAEILKKLASSKPEAAAFDYDGTLEESGKAASAETGEALKALSDSGVETMVLTDRSLFGRRDGDTGILDSLSTLTDAQRAAIVVGAQRGARIVSFNGYGKPGIVEEAAGWTDNEKAILQTAAQATAMKYGSAQVNGRRISFTDYDFAMYLPAGATDQDAETASQALRERLAELKLRGHVVPRRAGPGVPGPYVTVSKYDKSLGMGRFLALREKLGRLRDAERLPRWMRGAAKSLLSLLPGQPVPSANALVVGDRMMGERGIDMPMALPGALAVAVGESADPRVDNLFLWNKQGHDGAIELARAASGPRAPQMEGMDWKAFAGLFTTRSLSIVAFLATTLAYAKIAIGAVGPASFGTLAALGGLISIAAGPLTGRIADKMSPRAGLALNAVLRGIFLLNLPLFTFFGAVNFGTLLLGAIANGWVLSSTMTMEGAYIRGIFGVKNVRSVNSLAQLNYFGLQIIFGLILGIGALVDGHNLLIPFYLAAGVNAALAPILWFTLPKKPLNPTVAKPKDAVAGPSAASRAAGFVRKYWKEALILGAAIATFPLIHSALPITAALTWWITRTPGFKAIMADRPLAGGVGLISLGAFLFYGLQSFALPAIAGFLVGKASSSLLLGKLLGALFLGQMISSSSMAQLPFVRIPFVGRIGLQKFVQGAVLAMVGAWVYTGLIPGSLLAAAAFVAGAAAMIAAAHRITEKGWIRLLPIGAAALALPALFFGSAAFMPILLGSLAVFGYFFGPASVSLYSYIMKRIAPDKIGAVMGIQGSLFNSAISLGIGALALLSSVMTPMLPGMLWVLVGLAAVVAGIFFLGSAKLPGLPKDSLYPKGDRK